MDYNAEMLALYFKELGYTKEQIEEALNENPYDYKYGRWEAIKKNDNKTMAITLKRNYVIPEDRVIEEIMLPDNSVSKYLSNTSYSKVVSIRDSLKDVRVGKNVILLSGLFKDEEEFLKYLTSKRKDYVACMCTRDMALYEEYYNMLKRVAKTLYYNDVKEYLGCNQYICTLKNFK